MDEWHTNECGWFRGKWNGFLFLWLTFFIRSQDFHYYFYDHYVSLSDPGKQLDKELQMSSLSVHHIGGLPL